MSCTVFVVLHVACDWGVLRLGGILFSLRGVGLCIICLFEFWVKFIFPRSALRTSFFSFLSVAILFSRSKSILDKRFNLAKQKVHTYLSLEEIAFVNSSSSCAVTLNEGELITLRCLGVISV